MIWENTSKLDRHSAASWYYPYLDEVDDGGEEENNDDDLDKTVEKR